ncbi:MAG: hypothetical protein IPK82_23560 [Polyangiaceae bacterium]|nr:hypothetical protein [Polyangiaceae bacterium]
MTQTLADLIQRTEGATINLARGLTLRLATAAPLSIEMRRDNQFPSPLEVRIIKNALAKVIGHAELYEATDFEEYRDHKHEIIRRVGLAILTDATAPDPDDVPMLEPTAAPLTYPARQEALFIVNTPPTYTE